MNQGETIYNYGAGAAIATPIQGIADGARNDMETPPKRTTRSWFLVDPSDRKTIPSKPGCYVVIEKGKPLYVGQSVNLRQRLGGYAIKVNYGGPRELVTPWGYLDDAYVKVKVSRRYGDWLMWEARLIKRLQPSMNWAGVKGRVS